MRLLFLKTLYMAIYVHLTGQSINRKPTLCIDQVLTELST